jgi:hypothetical protein
MKSTSLYFKFPGNKNGTGVCPGSFRRRNWCGTLSLLLDPNESLFYVLQEIIDSSHSHLVKVKNKKIFLSFFYPCHSISPVALYSSSPHSRARWITNDRVGVGGWAVWLLYGRWVGRRRVFLSRIMSRSHSADWVGILFFFLLLLFDRCFI